MKRMLIGIIGILLLLGAATVIVLNQASFGKLPSGARLERIRKSPNFKDGKFMNLHPTPLLADGKSILQVWIASLRQTVKDLRPAARIPSVKTDLKAFDSQENVLVWMGHSSLYLQISGKRILVDPVLVSASPFSFYNKAFKGSDSYTPDDVPEIDYLLLTHDHWDHLDYKTIIGIKDRVRQFICPLGVGAHLEYWGVRPDRIHEVDWKDSLQLDGPIKLTALPARHFSGRGLASNRSLWAGYMLQCPLGNVLISGDTGYDTHFQAIKKEFGTIDLAILENGQYNEDWKYIHIQPEELVRAIEDLRPRKVMTVHNSKYALGRHAWYEPLDKIYEASRQHHFDLITPKIGEPVHLDDTAQRFTKWWESAPGNEASPM